MKPILLIVCSLLSLPTLSQDFKISNAYYVTLSARSDFPNSTEQLGNVYDRKNDALITQIPILSVDMLADIEIYILNIICNILF